VLAPRDVLTEAPTSEAAALYFDEQTVYWPAPFFELVFAPDAEVREASELRVRSTKTFSETVIEIEQRFVAPCRWVAARKSSFALGELMPSSDISLETAREVATCLAEAGALCRVAFTPR
jgi:hypothetical protein